MVSYGDMILKASWNPTAMEYYGMYQQSRSFHFTTFVTIVFWYKSAHHARISEVHSKSYRRIFPVSSEMSK
jgi:hypothetical protein